MSLNTLLLLALNRAVAATLLRTPVAGRWLYPVNMRGAVTRGRDDMNLSSGFYLTVTPEDTPDRLDQRVRKALADNRHWLYWYAAQVGRLVGQRGVDWLCGRFLRGAPHLGSFTSLGEWRLDLARAGFSPRALVTLCGPGSPNHPVSNGAMIVNGCLTLSLKLDPVLGADAAVTRTCLAHWHRPGGGILTVTPGWKRLLAALGTLLWWPARWGRCMPCRRRRRRRPRRHRRWRWRPAR